MKVRKEGSKERGERRRELAQSVVIHLYRNWQRSGRRGGDWRDGEGREGEGGPWGGGDKNAYTVTVHDCTKTT